MTSRYKSSCSDGDYEDRTATRKTEISLTLLLNISLPNINTMMPGKHGKNRNESPESNDNRFDLNRGIEDIWMS